MKTSDDREGLAWQVSVWDRISQIYLREVDKRFAQVVEHVIKRAGLTAGQQVLDLGTGTGFGHRRRCRSLLLLALVDEFWGWTSAMRCWCSRSGRQRR